MAIPRTHYDNLKVARNAPDAIIRAAYKVLMQNYHPDKFEGTEQEALRITKLIKNSYDVLIDPVKRAEHDRWIDDQQREDAQFSEVEEEQYSQKQNTQRESTPPPQSPPESKQSKGSTPTHSWRRFFARYIDYTISSLLIALVLVLWQAIGFQVPNWITHILYNPEMSAYQDAAIWAFFSALLWVIVEPTCLSIFGTTPGKDLFRLRLVSDNKEPNYWGRSIAVWSTGTGFNIPIISFFTMINASTRLKKNGKTDWDIKTGFNVEAEPLSIIRIAALIALLVPLVIVDSVMRQMESKTRFTQEPRLHVQAQQSTPSSANEEQHNTALSNIKPIENNAAPTDLSNIKRLPETKLGDILPDGGIVFHVDASGNHGLAAQPANEVSPTDWYEAIQLVSAHGRGWRMPNENELDMLYQKKNVVGGFANDEYWCSTSTYKFNEQIVSYKNFGNGIKGDYNVFNTLGLHKARAVRGF